MFDLTICKLIQFRGDGIHLEQSIRFNYTDVAWTLDSNDSTVSTHYANKPKVK